MGRFAEILQIFTNFTNFFYYVEDNSSLFVAFVGAGGDCVGVWEGSAAEGLFGDVGDDGD